MPRDIQVVIGDILGSVPETELALRAELLKIRNRAPFTAPEVMWMRWSEASTVLRLAIPHVTPADSWQAEVCRIFTGREK